MRMLMVPSLAMCLTAVPINPLDNDAPAFDVVRGSSGIVADIGADIDCLSIFPALETAPVVGLMKDGDGRYADDCLSILC